MQLYVCSCVRAGCVLQWLWTGRRQYICIGLSGLGASMGECASVRVSERVSY